MQGMHLNRALCGVFTLCSPLLLHAGGLRVPVDNGLGIPGSAGGAALAVDASTGITNPAGLVRIQNPELVVAVNPAFTSTEFTGSSTIEAYEELPPLANVQTATQYGSANGKLNAPLMAIHFSYPLRDFLVYGFSFNNPFGQSANFPEESIISSTITEATLITWNISNALGYKINENWSIGAGFDVQRLDFIAENIFPGALTIRPDIYTKNEASDWKFGWHGGVLFQFNEEKSRIGFNYRSEIKHDATGKSYANVTMKYPSFSVPDPLPIGPASTNRDFTVSFNLPPIYTLSGFHRINETWDIMATVDFSQWEVYEDISFTNMINVGDKVVMQNYHNTWTLTGGSYYHFNPNFYVGLGVRFDESPMDNQYRSVEYPDSNVWIVGVSGGYQFNKVVRLELGYAQSFFKEEGINTYDADSTVNNVGEGQLNAAVINTQLTINLAPVFKAMEQP